MSNLFQDLTLKLFSVMGPHSWYIGIFPLGLEVMQSRCHHNNQSQLPGTRSQRPASLPGMIQQNRCVCLHIQNMTTFRDFLVYNNDLDVGPFLQPVQKMQQFYFEQGKLYSNLSDEKKNIKLVKIFKPVKSCNKC